MAAPTLKTRHNHGIARHPIAHAIHPLAITGIWYSRGRVPLGRTDQSIDQAAADSRDIRRTDEDVIGRRGRTMLSEVFQPDQARGLHVAGIIRQDHVDVVRLTNLLDCGVRIGPNDDDGSPHAGSGPGR